MISEVTDRTFDRMVEDATTPVLVEFWKPGCGNCRALTRQLEQLEARVAGQVTILKMNVDENFQIPAELEISSLPVLALYRKGLFERFLGGIVTKDEILKQLALS